jgi:predicted nucleic acid-binding protein
MRQGERAFVDTGAWIALALVRDPLHSRAREVWGQLLQEGVRLFTSVPVVLETFTFLERNARRDVALAWKDAVSEVPALRLLDCTARDLEAAWAYFRRRDLHRLSAVDATSFVLMSREKIRTAFAFDHHFAAVGFRLAG